MYFRVYVKKIKSSYTYKYEKDIEIGSFCEINFRNKLNIGIIIDKMEKIDNVTYEIKEIIRILDIPKIPKELLNLSIFINNYYISDFFSSINLLGPYENMKIDRAYDEEELKLEFKDDILLNEEQENVFRKILNSDEKFHLLYGITGSGKTQIYIKLIKEALKKGKSVIFLLPEITLTTQILKSMEKVFGKNISLIHSKMTISNKTKEWEKIYIGKSKIIIGARSAIFAPTNNLEYIIIDEEHENTYKQEEKSRYHIRNVAIKRAMLSGAKVIFGSATPSFESFYYSKINKFNLLELKNRFNNAKLPIVEIVDLEKEEDILSKRLLTEMKNTLEKQEQVILILNRKSYSNLVKCESCNEKLKCPRCSVSLQYYKSNNILKCSHCEYSKKFINKCPNCNKETLYFLGEGIEKIEEKLNELFGRENILRMDSSTMNTNNKIKKAYEDFSKKKYSILIGTQIAAKGFHFPDVTLVGIVNADQILSFNDFRVGEKTFQLITQAAGRAGRAEKEGKVIIQTYEKDSILMKSIEKQDFLTYFEYELSLRKMLNLPPFSKFIKIIISSKNEDKAFKQAKKIYFELKNKFLEITEINKANIYKINDRYRYIIYIKSELKEIKRNKEILRGIKDLSNSSVRIIVDIDPITMD